MIRSLGVFYLGEIRYTWLHAWDIAQMKNVINSLKDILKGLKEYIKFLMGINSMI